VARQTNCRTAHPALPGLPSAVVSFVRCCGKGLSVTHPFPGSWFEGQRSLFSYHIACFRLACPPRFLPIFIHRLQASRRTVLSNGVGIWSEETGQRRTFNRREHRNRGRLSAKESALFDEGGFPTPLATRLAYSPGVLLSPLASGMGIARTLFQSAGWHLIPAERFLKPLPREKPRQADHTNAMPGKL
jgi:hypothetical protein